MTRDEIDAVAFAVWLASLFLMFPALALGLIYGDWWPLLLAAITNVVAKGVGYWLEPRWLWEGGEKDNG